MNAEAPGVSHGGEGVETEASGFLDGTLFPLTRMQPHESVLLHAPSVSLLHSFLPLTVHYCSFWGRVEERARSRQGRDRCIVPLRGRRSEEPGFPSGSPTWSGQAG